MSLFNLIWIAAFLYYGFSLTFTGIAGINYGWWDEIIGIIMLLTAGSGLYFVIMTAVRNITGLSGRIKKHASERSYKQNVYANYGGSEASEDVFEVILPEGSEESSNEPVAAPPDLCAEEQDLALLGNSGITAAEESLRRLKEEFSLDKY